MALAIMLMNKTMNKKILIACEESQAITKAFRKLGFEAYSCDLQECSGGNPEWHIQGDALKEAYSGKYDMMIAHPPCTYIANSGNRWLYVDGKRNEPRWKQRKLALEFVKKLMDAPIEKIAIENPISAISSEIKKPTQIIQPYHFGDKVRKATCLWLKNLPKLRHTKVVKPEIIRYTNGKTESVFHRETFNLPYSERGKARSKTFQGIANAIANQWSVAL